MRPPSTNCRLRWCLLPYDQRRTGQCHHRLLVEQDRYLLDALKTEILGGADAAYDTLVEIQQLLQTAPVAWTPCWQRSTTVCGMTRLKLLTEAEQPGRAPTLAQPPPSMSATPTPTS